MTTTKPVIVNYTESTLFALIKKRYESPMFELFRNVGNATGMRGTNYADGIAVGTWPSRGLHVHGFEIKCNRGDWLRELKQPQKAEAFYKWCDFWWIVTAPGIVKEGELPATWGLLEAKGDKSLTVVRDAPKNPEPQAVSKSFLASLARAANNQSDLTKIKREEYQRGLIEGRAKAPEAYVERSLKELREKVQQFEQASGLRIEHGWAHIQLGEEVRRVLDMDQKTITAMANIAIQAENIAAGYRKAFEKFQEALTQDFQLKLASDG